MSTPDDSLRQLAAATTLSAAMLQSSNAAAAGAKLLVFLHVATKQRALEGLLQSALGGIVVTAVGRNGDFDRALNDAQDAVLSLPAVLRAKNLTPQLQGYRQSAADEIYSLVGVDAAPDPSRVGSVGAIDLFGRNGTRAFVQGLLGSQPKVEPVTKIEDLLPLLQLQNVEAILLPARFVPDLKLATKLNLVSVDLPKRVGLPAVAIAGPQGAGVLSAIAQMSASAMQAIGVDSWR